MKDQSGCCVENGLAGVGWRTSRPWRRLAIVQAGKVGLELDMVALSCYPGAQEAEAGVSMNVELTGAVGRDSYLKLEDLVYGLGQKQWEWGNIGVRGHMGSAWWNEGV